MASSDPVAAKSSFLCMYMSNHPDTLVSYAKHYGKIKEKVLTAQMTTIDTQGMTLTYSTKKESKGTVRVQFEPPLSGYEEVKPRLLSMKVDAEEALGMSKAPVITSFNVSPTDVLLIAPLIALLVYTTYAPAGATPTTPAWLVPGALLRATVGELVVKGSWALMFTAHALEGLYVARLCKKHQTGWSTGAKYVGTTVALGFPGWKEFRRTIQRARIDSIMKGN